MIRKILFSIASIFLIWQSYKLLGIVETIEINSVGVLVFIAWIINLFITGIFAFAGFAFPTQRMLPDSFYEVKQPKILKKVYKTLRVDLFRQMLLATLWKSKKQQKKYFDGSRNGIANLIKQSMKSEFGHLIPFIIINVLSVWLIFIGLAKLSVCVFAINFIGNFYPIILQRHHRMRIQVLEKIQKRKSPMR